MGHNGSKVWGHNLGHRRKFVDSETPPDSLLVIAFALNGVLSWETCADKPSGKRLPPIWFVGESIRPLGRHDNGERERP